MLIYKYTGHAKITLAKGMIKVSRAADFNDPFELAPTIGPGSFDPKTIRTMLLKQHVIDEFYNRETSGTVPRPVYEKHYRKTLSSRVVAESKKVLENAEFVRAEFANMFDSHQRLFCVSKVSDSILMWSHYADLHRGCILGFDSEKPPFSELREWKTDVNYVDDKVPFKYNADPKQWRKSLFPVVAAKFKDWEYEKEVRYIFPGSGPELVPIPPETFKSVTFGCRMPDPSLILGVLNEPRYAHIEIRRARMSKDHFALEFETVREGKK